MNFQVENFAMDGFKEKLRNILHSNQFCGICIEKEEHISTLDDSFQIIVNGQCYSKTLREIVEVVFLNVCSMYTSSLFTNDYLRVVVFLKITYCFKPHCQPTYSISCIIYFNKNQ